MFQGKPCSNCKYISECANGYYVNKVDNSYINDTCVECSNNHLSVPTDAILHSDYPSQTLNQLNINYQNQNVFFQIISEHME